MRPFLLILCVSLLVISCKRGDRVPANVLPEKDMRAVLWDMMRADQFLTTYVLPKDSSLNRVTESSKLYGQVFAIHKISKEEFERSFSFYRSHPSLMKVIMDSLSRSSYEVHVDTVQPVKPSQAYDTSKAGLDKSE